VRCVCVLLRSVQETIKIARSEVSSMVGTDGQQLLEVSRHWLVRNVVAVSEMDTDMKETDGFLIRSGPES
jgi:hypothetical protein